MEKARKLTRFGVVCFGIVALAFLLVGTASLATAADEPGGSVENISTPTVRVYNPYTLTVESAKTTLTSGVPSSFPGNLKAGPPSPRIPRRPAFRSPVRPPWSW